MSRGNQRSLAPLNLLAVDAGLVLLLCVRVLVEPRADKLLTDEIAPVGRNDVGTVGGVRTVRVAVGGETALLVEGDDELDDSADALPSGRVDELARLGKLVLNLTGEGLSDLQERRLEKISVDLVGLRCEDRLDGRVDDCNGSRLGALSESRGLADGMPPVRSRV